MQDKIQLKHPAGKQATRIDAGKYRGIKAALTTVLQQHEALSHTDLFARTKAWMVKNKTPFEGNYEWYMQWVKMDMEAAGELERTNDKPQRYRLTAQNS